MLETALQDLGSTPFAAVLHCRLSRSAAEAEDLESACAFLNACPPEPDEVEVDGELRIAFATIDARRGGATSILDLVGREGEEIPFWTQELTSFAAGYRTHAYEANGDLATRDRLLRAACTRFGRGLVLGILRVEKIAPGARPK